MNTVEVAARPQAVRVVRRVAHIMGMPISLALRGREAGTLRGEDAWAEAKACLVDVDRVFSTFRTESVISRIDRGEADLVESPIEVAEVLALGEQARLESHGAFDVRREGRLDPSGVVKGWAVDRAARALRHLPDTDFCLSAGGDLVASVVSADREPWRIGIEDPHDPRRVVAVVPVRDGAVATSGLTHRGGHIVDPRTGEVARALASVTVIASDLTTADIDATAAFTLGTVGAHWLRSRGRDGVLVHVDGRTEVI